MSWSLQIPFRSRSAPLSDVADAAHVLATEEDRAVVRQLVIAEMVGGSARTVGEDLRLASRVAACKVRS